MATAFYAATCFQVAVKVERGYDGDTNGAHKSRKLSSKPNSVGSVPLSALPRRSLRRAPPPPTASQPERGERGEGWYASVARVVASEREGGDGGAQLFQGGEEADGGGDGSVVPKVNGLSVGCKRTHPAPSAWAFRGHVFG